MLRTRWHELRLSRAPLGRWAEQGTGLGDGVLALVLAALAFVPTLSEIGGQIGDLPERPANLLSVALVLAQTLPLAARRRWPAATLGVVGGAFCVHQALGFPTTFGSMGLYLALYSVGAHQARHRRGVAAAATAGYAVLAVVLHVLGSPTEVPDYLTFSLALVAVWLVGGTVRARRRGEAERRRLTAEVATTTERARIARELHDVVTHHVTSMVVQSDAAQFVLTAAPDRAAESMTAVSDTGRRALTELRYLLGVLEATGESGPGSGSESASADAARAGRAPTLGRVADLVEQARRSGQPVEFTEQGERRPQSVDVELAAYRVVQEGLTNAMKYAAGRPTRVLLRHGEHLGIELTTEGPAVVPAPGGPSDDGGGRGLAGLRTRVGMLDGRLEAGPRPEGGFVIRATIPAEPIQE